MNVCGLFLAHSETANQLLLAQRAPVASISALFPQLFFFLKRLYGLVEHFLNPLDYFLTFISCFYHSNGAPEEDI